MNQPCVGSGFCCKQAPCGYGEATSPADPACMFLEVDRELLGVSIHRCGKYEEVKGSPGSEASPAFGAGCSSTLFNGARAKIIAALRTESS